MEKELRKRRWIIKRKLDGWANQVIASHLRISERTVIRWWNAYQEQDWNGLVIRSRRPRIIHRTNDNIVEKVLELRKKEEYGPNKMEAILRNQGLKVGHSTIYRILKDHRLNNPIDKPRKTWGKTRFQREHTNSLWQTDFKLTEKDKWMLTFIDDHSRFIVGCKIDEDATTELAIRLLEKSIQEYGKPKQILSDRGTQFFCSEKDGKEQGISQFTQFCLNNEIQHIVASKRRPTTTGKVERWHRTYDEEHHKFKILRWFVHYYNFKRPHQ